MTADFLFIEIFQLSETIIILYTPMAFLPCITRGRIGNTASPLVPFLVRTLGLELV